MGTAIGNIRVMTQYCSYIGSVSIHTTHVYNFKCRPLQTRRRTASSSPTLTVLEVTRSVAAATDLPVWAAIPCQGPCKTSSQSGSDS